MQLGAGEPNLQCHLETEINFHFQVSLVAMAEGLVMVRIMPLVLNLLAAMHLLRCFAK